MHDFLIMIFNILHSLLDQTQFLRLYWEGGVVML